MTYLYNYLGEPWNCQKWIREIAKRFYGTEPGSLSGNDDCGQMSAWYMFNCLGFYPVAPSSNIYNIGSPCVKGLTVKLSNGKYIKMTTENWSEKNVYIKEMLVNGKKYNCFVTIKNGNSSATSAVEQFECASTPSFNVSNISKDDVIPVPATAIKIHYSPNNEPSEIPDSINEYIIDVFFEDGSLFKSSGVLFDKQLIDNEYIYGAMIQGFENNQK